MKQSYFFMLVILAGSAVGLALGTAFSGRDSLNNGETAAAPMALMSNQTAQTAPAQAPRAEPEPAAAEAAPAPAAAAAAEQTAAAELPAAPAPQAAELPAAPAPQAAEPPAAPAAQEQAAPAAAETAAAKPAAAETAAAEKPAEPAKSAAAEPAKTAAAAERGILNGYKGFRHHRPGYKSNGDGWWYPRAAFAGSSKMQKFMETASAANVKPAPAAAKPAEKAKAAPKARAKAPAMSRNVALSRHEQWCAARHPSYDARDNSYRETFTKEYCRSPYLQYL